MTSRKIFRAIILGAPASGKGTISNRIINNFQFHYIASGDILRQHIHLNTQLGREAKTYITKGQLVPDRLVIQCILDKINAIGNDSWLLDGFPRTTEQASELWNTQTIDSVINLIVPHDVIIERIRGRWIHLESGRVYNTGFNEPKVAGLDDVTGEPLVQRDDDKPATVKHRLEVYDKQTKPVIEWYRDHGILTEFRGKTSDEIWPGVRKYLIKKLA